jgi:TetR/AcrR family transcriptional regulator of autoinduction and epiphytic fitness
VGVEQKEQHTDGRVARGERTREAIVAAHTALLLEGVLKPTGQAIAERAGVSVRTLWANFKDLEALLNETTAYWLAADDELRQVVDPSKPLGERIATFCAERGRRLEHIAPAARSAALGEPFSPALKRSREVHLGRLRSETEAVFARELESVSDAERDELMYALITATGWPNWQLLHDDFNLSPDEVVAVMRKTCHALLDPLE